MCIICLNKHTIISIIIPCDARLQKFPILATPFSPFYLPYVLGRSIRSTCNSALIVPNLVPKPQKFPKIPFTRSRHVLLPRRMGGEQMKRTPKEEWDSSRSLLLQRRNSCLTSYGDLFVCRGDPVWISSRGHTCVCITDAGAFMSLRMRVHVVTSCTPSRSR